ncbi:MAG: FHIPEP family type III secretion protein [Polyangiaceae bacterium]|nr:FHIPEP family type III secretion protein [Polyangiaceae bacterium]
MIAQKPVSWFGRRPTSGLADAVLAALVVAVVGLMIVPLPTWLLDILLATNLATAVAVLLVTLYVTDALKIAAFPTLLLITTLVRLGLNVASTRLILLQANAGEVIRSFGTFVVRSNYVVGAVVFLILSIIQFVVIAKGSERVAEVGARFTLDAMPGKQMAIDAELRAGTIDGTEAHRRRRQLSRESQFYGAMDGAMKFVKGDVIASFIITIINILGGIAIGVAQKDMALSDALKRYGLLTIGDGLVTQIPALVLATSAGVLVTRVASDEPDTPLGTELGRQLLGAPRALRAASVFLLLLSAVPGLPALPFLFIGSLLLLASRARSRQLYLERGRAPSQPLPHAHGEAAARFVPVVEPWSLEVSEDLERLIEDDTRGEQLRRAGIRSAAAALRELVFREIGVPLPAGQVVVGPGLPAHHVVLSIHEVPAKALPVAASVTDDDLAEHLVAQVFPLLRERAADFVGIGETQALLDQLEQIAPATVRQVVPKPVTVTLLADVLRRLVEEGLCIRDLRGILESMAQVAPTDKDPLTLAEFVRAQMRRTISYQLTQGRADLSAYLLDPMIEETIRGAISRTPAGSFLTLAPAAGRDIVGAVRRVLSPGLDSETAPVVLTRPDVRRFVRKLIETELPTVRVVSYAELLPELAIRPVATVRLTAGP